LRALLIESIENYDEFVEGLMAWNATREPGMRPVEVPKIDDVSKLIEMVGRLVTRQHEIRNRSSISITDFHRVMSLMGAAVATCVGKLPVPEAMRDRCFREIEDMWGNASVDAKRPIGRKALPEPSVDVEVLDVVNHPA
jgi:hypothetical protein